MILSTKNARDVRAAKRAKEAIDKRIEAIYYRHCPGVQVSIMDIGKIFDHGLAAIAANPTINDVELSSVIVSFVQTIRKN
jgi:hypothetical protein